jgi:4-amino-4-deoxy-L-arabinose transferase-like glycosyltransferase
MFMKKTICFIMLGALLLGLYNVSSAEPFLSSDKSVIGIAWRADTDSEFFTNIWNSANQAYDWAKTVLANYLSSMAVMLVTTIAVPIILLLAFIWTVKYLTRKDFAALILSSIGAGEDDKPKETAS